MIRYLTHDQIDFAKWDECIEKSVNGLFYAYSWYLDMCASPWDALVMDDYQAVMPLPHRKKFSIRYIYQPFFIQQMGVFSRDRLASQRTEQFINAIPAHFKYAAFNLNIYNSLPQGHQAIGGKGVTHELDLILPYEKIKKNYSENTKRNIRKAEKKGVFVTSHARPEEIIQAFRKQDKSIHVPFREKDYKLLKHLIYSGMHKQMVDILAAYSETNNFCAGIVFFKSHKKAILLFSGSTPEARENGAMSLLVDHFIRTNAGKEMVLDFEGSTNAGLARFYKSFGSKECLFLQIRLNRMPFMIKPLISGALALKERSRRFFIR